MHSSFPQNTLKQRFAEGFPLSAFGGCVLVASLLLLGQGFLDSDALALIVGGIGFMLCLLVVVLVMTQSPARFREQVNWNAGADLVAGHTNESHSAGVAQWGLPPFLRIRVRITGWQTIGTADSAVLRLYRYRRSFTLRGAESRTLPIHPPVPGILNLSATFSIRDIFGLCTRYIRKYEEQAVHVLPASVKLREFDDIVSQFSEDDEKPKKQSDTEKIFIRDYQPGDRARDINWKASGRIDKLLTRIAPESESPVRTITLVVCANSFLHDLACIKSLLRGCMESTLEADESTQFRIWLGDELHEIAGDSLGDVSGGGSADLRSFYKLLASWRPTSLPSRESSPAVDSNIYFFSHESCPDLSNIIRNYAEPTAGGGRGTSGAEASSRFFIVRSAAGNAPASAPSTSSSNAPASATSSSSTPAPADSNAPDSNRLMLRFPGRGFIPLRIFDMGEGFASMLPQIRESVAGLLASAGRSPRAPQYDQNIRHSDPHNRSPQYGAPNYSTPRYSPHQYTKQKQANSLFARKSVIQYTIQKEWL